MKKTLVLFSLLLFTDFALAQDYTLRQLEMSPRHHVKRLCINPIFTSGCSYNLVYTSYKTNDYP